VGETLQRASTSFNFEANQGITALRDRIRSVPFQPPFGYEAFIADPLVSWIETTLGLTTEKETGRLKRAVPISITGDDGCCFQLNRRASSDFPPGLSN